MPLVDCSLHKSTFCSETLSDLLQAVFPVCLSLDTVVLPVKLL